MTIGKIILVMAPVMMRKNLLIVELMIMAFTFVIMTMTGMKVLEMVSVMGWKNFRRGFLHYSFP